MRALSDRKLSSPEQHRTPCRGSLRRAATLTLAMLAALLATAAGPAQADDSAADYANTLCKQANPHTDHCSAGNGRKTRGGAGTGKVSHKGWPAIDGVFWSVFSKGRGKHRFRGGALPDELLGHHGDDSIFGGAGSDVLWGDWDPKNNNTRQRDRLSGGDGNDFLYASHGRNRMKGGSGKDLLYAFYGRGTIDCGPGKRDTARVRMNRAYKVRNCEIIRHFCAFGSHANGTCRKPGEARRAARLPVP